jgi:hypothetical protein
MILATFWPLNEYKLLQYHSSSPVVNTHQQPNTMRPIITERVVLKVFDFAGRVAMAYGIYSAGTELAEKVDHGLMHMMSGRGSGGDHMETGLRAIGESISGKGVPLQVQVSTSSPVHVRLTEN